MQQLRLRRPEWILTGFFAYVVLLAPFFRDRTELGIQPLLVLGTVLAFFWPLCQLSSGRLGKGIEVARDWLPLLLTLVAFREMELFLTRNYNLAYETAWIQLDQLLLNEWRLRAAIESLGKALPFYLEICYLLVYGISTYCLAVLVAERAHTGKIDHHAIDAFLTVYLLGTLGSYALFPFFPSEPPRYAFPDVAPPAAMTWARQFNLWILSRATIHTGVFPSAHVSAAFSCAWGMFFVRARRQRLCWALVAYAVSVSVATVYGRYHYAADVLAGFAVSLVAAGIVYGSRKYAGRKG
ncbi:MAG TPA: phosphatase PAP2 family protein [Bryobacteraceae bacterium]|nr:phosphatase PAP2 family protein [Bryobacteraceae bacterium]